MELRANNHLKDSYRKPFVGRNQKWLCSASLINDIRASEIENSHERCPARLDSRPPKNDCENGRKFHLVFHSKPRQSRLMWDEKCYFISWACLQEICIEESFSCPRETVVVRTGPTQQLTLGSASTSNVITTIFCFCFLLLLIGVWGQWWSVGPIRGQHTAEPKFTPKLPSLLHISLET